MDQSSYWQQQHGGHSQYQQFSNTNQYDNQNVYAQHDANIQWSDNLHYSSQDVSQNNFNQRPQESAGGDWDNWAWGDDDNSNVESASQQNAVENLGTNKNTIQDSFVNDESWNWSLEEPRAATQSNVSHTSNKQPNWNQEFQMGRKDPPVQPRAESLAESASHETPLRKSDNTYPLSSISAVCSVAASSFEPPAPSSKYFEDPVVKPPDPDDTFHGQDSLENKEIVSNIKRDSATSKSSNYPSKFIPPISASTQGFSPFTQPGTEDKDTFRQVTAFPNKPPSKFQSTAPRSDYKQPGSFQLRTVNLETPPDNSEQPDQVPQRAPVKKSVTPKSSQQWQENSEVPINDRNQYLETGRLSAVDAPDITQDNNDTLPPPGLRRMVLGQMEQPNSSGNLRGSDEPPPGLSRIVLGQREGNNDLDSSSDNLRQTFNPIEPPEGLHRMVPGESSSPESVTRQQQRQEESDYRFAQSGSHTAEPRSATLGADTPPLASSAGTFPLQPPSSNRSETIGANISNAAKTNSDNSRSRSQNISNENRLGAVGIDSSGRNKDNLSKKHDTVQKNLSEDSYRDAVEGQPQETISSIVNSIRNLTVGENTNDEIGSGYREANRQHNSRQESSESEPELSNYRDDRYREKNDKSRRTDKRDREDRYENDGRLSRGDRQDDRYSPDAYRDNKYSSRRRYKDRRYEEETDYYSDKERDRRSRNSKHHDKNYYSLQRDKDRRKREHRDYAHGDREYRRNYYYSRHDDESMNDSRSRASSRSDSVHNSYRERDGQHRSRENRHYETERRRRYRDPFIQYSQGYAYDPYSQYYQQYQYYERLRRTDPQAYAELYRKYYQQNASQVGYDNEDRASVHSGRSSANEGLTKERFIQSFDHTESSINLEDPTLTSHRLTPAKFATAHVKGSISSGRLIRLLPHYPLDGQAAVVEVCSIESVFANDDEYKELILFPGPLVRGTTHKKTIIEYCENKIKVAAYANIVDVESYVLLWELLILLIRQNGMVVGADIAELLLKNRNWEPFQRPSSVASSISSIAADQTVASECGNQHLSEVGGSTLSVMKESEITNKFREYLLYGSCKEALEWAMKNSLWGHALFLASKLDKRTYANVMMRFANGLALNDPLQTLYQLLSGRIPAVVTCVADEKWGDWRPHLAMILSNTTQHPEVNCKAVTTLGDTLFSRGCLYAAQFCYLMAEVGFGSYGDSSSKLVLLGSDHTRDFPQFAINEAIHMTEIYEFACSLNNSEFVLPNFQLYKYLVATRLADCGLLDKSLSYLEGIANTAIQNHSAVSSSLLNDVYSLADRLKYHDPLEEVGDSFDNENLGANRPDHTWLKQLKELLDNNTVEATNLNYETDYNAAGLYETAGQAYDPMVSIQNPAQQLPEYTEQYQQTVGQAWAPDQIPQPNHLEYQYPSSGEYGVQESAWPGQNQWEPENLHQDNFIDPQQTTQQFQSYYGPGSVDDSLPKPQISMPNQSKPSSNLEESPQNDKASPVKAKPQPPQPEKPASTGWFGGIFSKLVPKPKNQMILPDDKNPTILWDPVKKRWINNDDDGSASSGDVKPPPKMTDLGPKPQIPSQMPQNIPDYSSDPIVPAQRTQADLSKLPSVPRSSTIGTDAQSAYEGDAKAVPDPNMFRMHGRSRNLKKSYVDVFNAGRKTSAPQVLPHAEPAVADMQSRNFFVPQPVNDPNAPVDFLTPAVPYSDNAQDDRGQYQ